MPSSISLDPRTALLIATLMMMLNGIVLGLMHKELAEDVRPSAFNWRVGTLLLAVACVLLALQGLLPRAFMLPFANGCLLLGLLAYLRAVSLFCNKRISLVYLLPILITVISIYWYTEHSPNMGARIVIGSFAMAILLLASAMYLFTFTQQDSSISQTALATIFLFIGMFMLIRGIYFLVSPTAMATILDENSWWNILTPIFAAILPVIGTTAYLLMCSHRMRTRWEIAASTDYLTGLPNRRSVVLAGNLTFHSAQRNKMALSVAVIDVDHFKNINDRFGHDAGDLALKHIVAVLETIGRKMDLLGRFGGEEFVVLLEQTNHEQALVIAQRMRLAVQHSVFDLTGQAITMTVSIGIATIQEADQSFDNLLQRADKALYMAKGLGRNRVEFADKLTTIST